MAGKGINPTKTMTVDATSHLGTLTTKITEILGEYKKPLMKKKINCMYAKISRCRK